MVSVHAQFTTLYALAQAQGCVVRIKIRSSPCHPCLHLRISPALTLHPLTLTSSSSIPSSRTTSQVTLPINKHCATLPNEESGPMANTTSLTGYEPNFFDDFHYSETTDIFLHEKSSDSRPSYLHDAELSDETIGRALSLQHCSFRNEKNQRAVDELITLLKKVCCQVSPLSVGHVSTGDP